ncbi:MAG: glycosyltransferase family 9 protein [candidate division NC10 bacterium]
MYRTFWALDRLGRIHTVRDLAVVDLDRIGGILVAVTTALGDSVTFTPGLTALRDRFPRTRIVGLFHRNFADLYRADARLDAVIPYHGKYRRWRETLNALRAERCELALVPYINDPDIIPLIYLGGSRIIFRTPGRNTIYRFMVANPNLLSDGPNPEHALVRCETMLRHLGCPVADLTPRLQVEAAQRDRVAAWLRARQVPPDAFLLGMHPGASIRETRWPAERFAETARALLREDAHRWLILTGSTGERALCETIREGCGAPDRAVNAAGDLPLPDLPALLERIGWLLANDTGVAHIAYATGTPSLTLFWRSLPQISGPLTGLDRHRVLSKGELCLACDAGRCVYPACANAITVDEVLAMARAALAGATATREPR